MSEEILFFAKELSVEVLVISLLVFALTMLFKWPIKKITAKFEEAKRKAVNSFIIFIPMVLSFLISVLYFGLTAKVWFSDLALQTAFSSWIMAFSVYAIFQRIVIVVKGIKSGKIQLNQKVLTDTVSSLKTDIKLLKNKLKSDEAVLGKIEGSKEVLQKLKAELEQQKEAVDLLKLYETNSKLSAINVDEAKLKQEIECTQTRIFECEKELKISKGEENG